MIFNILFSAMFAFAFNYSYGINLFEKYSQLFAFTLIYSRGIYLTLLRD